MHYNYDALKRRSSIELKSETNTTVFSQSYSYGPASRLLNTASGDVSIDYSYHANSPLVESITHSHNSAPVMTSTKSYDLNNRLTEIESTTSAFTVSRHEYSHTALNQRNRVDLKDGSYWLYEYNSKGEVIKGERYDASNVLITGQSFGYSFDGIGNREDTTLDSIAKAAYSANALNQYTSITTPTPTTRTLLHDADGNLIDDGTYLYEWDGENRLNIVKRKSDNKLIHHYFFDYQSRRQGMTGCCPSRAFERGCVL